jgi:hypothetical protein
MSLDVLLIYRLMPRMHGLHGYTATFGTIPISRFFRAFCSVHEVTGRTDACFLASVDSQAMHYGTGEV